MEIESEPQTHQQKTEYPGPNTHYDSAQEPKVITDNLKTVIIYPNPNSQDMSKLAHYDCNRSMDTDNSSETKDHKNYETTFVKEVIPMREISQYDIKIRDFQNAGSITGLKKNRLLRLFKKKIFSKLLIMDIFMIKKKATAELMISKKFFSTKKFQVKKNLFLIFF